MKTVIVVYDEDCKELLASIEAAKEDINFHYENYQLDNIKERRKAYKYLNSVGSSVTPLVVVEDENMEVAGALWGEDFIDVMDWHIWGSELIKLLKDV